MKTLEELIALRNEYRAMFSKQSVLKTLEELFALNNEFKSLFDKLSELTEEELQQVTGGIDIDESTLFVPPRPTSGKSGR